MAEKNPIVTLEVADYEPIKIELYPEIAPNTVNNFISLVNQGFYNGLTFHRIIKGFIISMARSMMPDSAGSQFFIMHKDAPHLDGQYAAFGKVIEGLDVVDRIACVDTDYGDMPLTPVVMTKVSVDTFGEDYPEPIKL